MSLEDLIDRKKTAGQEIVVRANRGTVYRVKFDGDGYATSVKSVRAHREILAGKKPGVAAKCAVQGAISALKAWR
jgi:hypothetical protein